MLDEFTFRPLHFYCYNFEVAQTITHKLTLALMLLSQVPGSVNMFDADDRRITHVLLPSTKVEWDFKMYEVCWKINNFFNSKIV